MTTEQCCDPAAPRVPCDVCGKSIFTCEREVPVGPNNDYRCPAHPNGFSVEDLWFCSDDCREKFEDKRLRLTDDELAAIKYFSGFQWTLCKGHSKTLQKLLERLT